MRRPTAATAAAVGPERAQRRPFGQLRHHGPPKKPAPQPRPQTEQSVAASRCQPAGGAPRT
eukprot:6938914-Lingulodinium_polyedra.AAC.1